MNNMNNMKLGNRVGSPRGVEERNHRFYPDANRPFGER